VDQVTSSSFMKLTWIFEADIYENYAIQASG